MISIPKKIYKEILYRAKKMAPQEICGILSGLDECVLTHYPMTNADESNEHYSLVPEEQFATAKAIRADGEKTLAVYHSHPASPARPSQEDIRLAFAPDVIHIILSLNEPTPDIRAFCIENEKSVSVPVVILEEE